MNPQPSTPVRVAIYTRISTDEVTQPYSLDAQTAALEKYAEAHGWEIVRRYSDQASGAKSDRPGLQKMLRHAKLGHFDLVLVYRLDRFSRSSLLTLNLLGSLDEAGVAFQSMTESFDTSTPGGRMFMQMLAAFAEHERALIIDRVRNGQKRKAARGKWVGGPAPYGYTIGGDSTLVIETAESVIVGEIFAAMPSGWKARERSRTGSTTTATAPAAASGSTTRSCVASSATAPTSARSTGPATPPPTRTTRSSPCRCSTGRRRS